MEGRTPVGWDLPPHIARVPSDVPYQPALMRALKESRALRRCLGDAARSGAPYDLVHTGHLPTPTRLPVPYTTCAASTSAASALPAGPSGAGPWAAPSPGRGASSA